MACHSELGKKMIEDASSQNVALKSFKVFREFKMFKPTKPWSEMMRNRRSDISDDQNGAKAVSEPVAIDRKHGLDWTAST